MLKGRDEILSAVRRRFETSVVQVAVVEPALVAEAEAAAAVQVVAVEAEHQVHSHLL